VRPAPRCPSAVARQIVAHGGTVGLVIQRPKPRQGRQNTSRRKSLSPHSGLDSIWFVHPRFHRGLLSSVAPRLPDANCPKRPTQNDFGTAFVPTGQPEINCVAADVRPLHPNTARKIMSRFTSAATSARPKAPGDWRSPRRFAPSGHHRPPRQRLGLRRPSAAFPRRHDQTCIAK
jgi:hypothetical protein